MYTEVQQSDGNELVIQHAPLLKRIAYHLISRLPASVQVEDLIQAGMIGLLEAARNYDATQGASFETYAGIRIRGAMMDEIRRGDWTPRSVHRRTREMTQAVREIENREGREAQDAEIARAMGISLDDYHALLRDAAGSRVLSFEDLGYEGRDSVETLPDKGEGPLDELKRAGFKEALAEAITQLPERERLVMALYYDEELNLREIGEVLGVSESRVCQIHGQALVRLRARLSDWQTDQA